MSAYNDGLNEAAQNAFCDITRRGVAGGLIFAGLTATTAAGLLAGLATSAISAHLYASYCGRPPIPPPYGTPQDWEGGQCEDVSYRVNVSIQLFLNPKGGNINVGRAGDVFDVIGPITLIEVYDTGPRDNDIRLRAVWKGGSRDVSFVKGTNDDPENPQWGYNDPQIVVTRNDNQPDICGNPPPNPPPDEFDAPGNVTYVTPEGDVINNPVTFNFGAGFIGVGGAFFMPVNIRFSLDPTLNLNGTINFNTGGFSPNFGPPGSPAGNGDGPGDVVEPPPPPVPPGTPPPPPPPGVPPDPVEPPTDPEEARPRKVIRGVIVTSIIESLPATVFYQGGNPDIYVPNLGHVSFLCKTSSGFSWTVDIPVKNAKHLIECPWRYGAVDVKGTAQPGVTFSLSPVYDIVGYS